MLRAVTHRKSNQAFWYFPLDRTNQIRAYKLVLILLLLNWFVVECLKSHHKTKINLYLS